MRTHTHAPRSHRAVRPMVASTALVAAGGAMTIAGAAVAGVTGVSTLRRWMHLPDHGPARLAMLRLGRGLAAGVDTWRHFDTSAH